MTRPQDWPEADIETISETFTRLMEVYIDDFIPLAQTTDQTMLHHLS
jgi:hypothetical protein